MSPTLQSLFSNTVLDYLLIVPFCLIVSDVLTGIGAAIKQHRFRPKQVSTFLSRDALRYMGAFSLVLLTWLIQGDAMGTSVAALIGMGPLSLSVTASLLENTHELLADYPLEEAVIEEFEQKLGELAQHLPSSSMHHPQEVPAIPLSHPSTDPAQGTTMIPVINGSVTPSQNGQQEEQWVL